MDKNDDGRTWNAEASGDKRDEKKRHRKHDYAQTTTALHSPANLISPIHFPLSQLTQTNATSGPSNMTMPQIPHDTLNLRPSSHGYEPIETNTTPGSSNKNADCRRRYAEVSDEKKEDRKRRRREKYAKKKATIQSTANVNPQIHIESELTQTSATSDPSNITPLETPNANPSFHVGSQLRQTNVTPGPSNMTMPQIPLVTLNLRSSSHSYEPMQTNTAPGSSNTNANRRRRYAEASDEKKEDRKRRRSEKYAQNKKALQSPTNVNPPIQIESELAQTNTTSDPPNMTPLETPNANPSFHVGSQLRQTTTAPGASNRSIQEKPFELPDAPNCEHCDAKRFHLEPKHFCCSNGSVSLVLPPMPFSLGHLFTSNDASSRDFRRNIRTYNNKLSFTSMGARYDKELTKNHRGMYTFRVQGTVYHKMTNLKSDRKEPGIHLYFYDTEDEVKERLLFSDKLDETILRYLMTVLGDNPYCRFLKNLRHVPNLDNQRVVLNCDTNLDQRRYNLPSVSQVGAIFRENESIDDHSERTAHIQVYTTTDIVFRIKHHYACYDSLSYPLLFPRGESGWHPTIDRKERVGGHSNRVDVEHGNAYDHELITSASALVDMEEQVLEAGKKRKSHVTAKEYYCYKLQIRESDNTMLLHSTRLLQQFVVDMYVKIETARLEFHRAHQNEVRSEILQGVLDSISTGQNEGRNIGKRVILPPSFVGGPRDMRNRYLDAMALVQKYGKPDIFLTMTCNPNWKEIQENLKYEETAFDRPDLVSRVFKAKFDMFRDELVKKKLFGDVAVCVHVIEFQKRGMPHAHMLIILKPGSKPLHPTAYDNIVSAELPDPELNPYFHSLVVKHMIHGPCGVMNRTNPCMRNGMCKSRYPKPFQAQTCHAEDGYPLYKRSQNGRSVRVRGHVLDNRWVIPHNPYLLALFDCHMNVEICSTVKLVKYIYKYIYKGHDRVSFKIGEVNENQEIDEIRDFQDGRWIGPSEAMWRIYGFLLNRISPSVYTLQVHLDGHQMVSFSKKSDLSSLLDEVDFKKTMLTEFFAMNRSNSTAQNMNLLYKEFPGHFVWNSKHKYWSKRKRGEVIGRLVTVSPKDGERYYLRLLLSHIRCPRSFDDLFIVNDFRCATYRDAALRLGLLNSDSYIEDSLIEATSFQFPPALRSFFAMLLVYCSPNDPKELYDRFEPHFSTDFERSPTFDGQNRERIRAVVLSDINKMLEHMGKHIRDYHLVSDAAFTEMIPNDVQDDMYVPVPEQDLLSIPRLNSNQKAAFDEIMTSVISGEGKVFFIDGPGGTGKTFLYRSLLAAVRNEGNKAIAVATSGVAASILPGGTTAHSRFKIPIDSTMTLTCQLSKQSPTASLITKSKLIIWDEASMAKRDTIEAFDLLLRDLMDNEEVFGGKIVVFGGDFRQTLPVISKGTRDNQVTASIVNSSLWKSMTVLKLTENMRALLDPGFSEYLLRVGEGLEPSDSYGNIALPKDIVIPFTDFESSLERLIIDVFPDLNGYAHNAHEMINRCILCPKNNFVDDINDMMITRFPGNAVEYTSNDATVDQRQQGDYEDFINSLNPKSLPPHKLQLKINCPIILLRNLNPTDGLCNGTRLICKGLTPFAIFAEIATGQHIGKQVFIPKIPLQSSSGDIQGIPFIRTQFPVRLCFAMTINKAQGQTLDFVGIYLKEPVFSHGQLYVALSRARTKECVRVLIMPATLGEEKNDGRTINVVFSEIFTLASEGT